jgi:hypothetical protein
MIQINNFVGGHFSITVGKKKKKKLADPGFLEIPVEAIQCLCCTATYVRCLSQQTFWLLLAK